MFFTAHLIGIACFRRQRRVRELGVGVLLVFILHRASCMFEGDILNFEEGGIEIASEEEKNARKAKTK